MNKTSNLIADVDQDITISKATLSSDGSTRRIHIITPKYPQQCPHCNSWNCVIKDSGKKRSVWHVPQSRKPCKLLFVQRRYLCNTCHSTFMEQLSWLHPGINMTNDLFDTIKKDLLHKISKKDLSAINGISSYYISKVASMIRIPRPKHLPEVICLDETSGDVKVFNKETRKFTKNVMVTNFSDGSTGEVLDVMPFIKLDKLKIYFNSYPYRERIKVKFLCCDMGRHYLNLAQHCFPNAIVCLDNFHIVQRLDKAMDQARLKYVKKLIKKGQKSEADALKKMGRKFKTRADHQEAYWGDRYDDIVSCMQYYFDKFPELLDTYAMLQYFHDIESNCFTFDYKKKKLELWIRIFGKSTSDIILSAVETIKEHKRYIYNAWENDLSNATCEGNNNLIKVIKKFSFGIHQFDYFRTRVLLICGREGLARSLKSPSVPESGKSFFYNSEVFPSLRDYILAYDWSFTPNLEKERAKASMQWE